MPKHLKGKRIEETRVITACQVIKDRLKMILDRTPEIEELPEFYQDYIDITVGVDDFKQALGALNWAYGIITLALENRLMEESLQLFIRLKRILTS